jgi:hypothetical protein
MTAEELKKTIDSLASHILFDYKGVSGGVDPFTHKSYDIWYGDDDRHLTSIDEVMNCPLFGGKSLNEIAEDLENVE